MHSRRYQRGLAAATVIIVLILVAVAFVLGRGFVQSGVSLSQRAVTDANLRRLSDVLVQYTSLNQRLPCPASGTQDTGLELADTTTFPYRTCTASDGVVPWSTLGLKRDHALDGWNRKISYRVFSGATGFTLDNGVNMTSCNTSLGAPIDPNMASGSLCQGGTPPPNTPAQFLGARGNMLVVEDSGTTRNGNAFVLISHGESGYGAFLAEGATARTTLPSAGGRELANTLAAGPFWMLPRSDPGTPPDAAGHFDDIVTYMPATELVAKARLAARSWSSFSLSATFSESDVNTALGFSLGSAEDTGRTSLSLGGFQVTATASGATRNIGFEQSGLGGLGVIGGSSTSGDLNSAFGEALSFQLGAGSEYGKMDVALNAFAVTDNNPLRREGAEISFWRSGTLLQTTTLNAWDRLGDTSRCLLRLPTGGTFDRMDLKAVDQTNDGGSSRFQVAGIKACTDSTTPCTTSIPGEVPCPMPPPSVLTRAATSIGRNSATLQGTVEENNPVPKGTGDGYRVSTFFFSIPVWTTSLTLNSGSGTILAGNCVRIFGDANTYVVAEGISGPGTLVLANPGILQSIPSFTTRTVTVTHCQAALSFEIGLTCSSFSSSAAASPATINAGDGPADVSVSFPGLSCDTNYCFRAKASNPGGTTTGNHQTFRTNPC